MNRHSKRAKEIGCPTHHSDVSSQAKHTEGLSIEAFRVDNLKKTRGLFVIQWFTLFAHCVYNCLISFKIGSIFWWEHFLSMKRSIICHFVRTVYDEACNAAYEKPHTGILRMHDAIQFCVFFLSRKILQLWNWKQFYSGAIKVAEFRLFLFCSYKMMKLLTCNCNKISGLATADLVFFVDWWGYKHISLRAQC